MPIQVVKRKDEYYQKLPINKEREYKKFDGGGLVMVVRPSGRKVWQYHYTFKGKRSVKTLGYHQKNLGESHHMTVARARIQRDKLKLAMLDGEAPNKTASPQNTVLTFENIAQEWIARQQWVR